MQPITHLNPETVAPPMGAYSHGVLVHPGQRLLAVSGQVGIARDGSLPATIEEQSVNAFNNLLRILEAAGMSAQHLVKITVFVTSGQSLAGLRAARSQLLGQHSPASTLVFVPQLVSPEYLVEVEAYAAL